VTQGRLHIGIPQHPRHFLVARFPGRHAHVTRRDATLGALRDDEMVIGVGGDLRQVRDDQRLPIGSGHARQRFPHPHTHLAADALIDFVENERRHRVMRREHDLQREHEARQLAA